MNRGARLVGHAKALDGILVAGTTRPASKTTRGHGMALEKPPAFEDLRSRSPSSATRSSGPAPARGGDAGIRSSTPE